MLVNWLGGEVAVVGGAVGATVGAAVGAGAGTVVTGAPDVAGATVVVTAGAVVVAGEVDPGAEVAAVALGLGLELPHAASTDEPAIRQMMRRAERFFTAQGYAAGRRTVGRARPVASAPSSVER
jgi:hypothetical protein